MGWVLAYFIIALIPLALTLREQRKHRITGAWAVVGIALALAWPILAVVVLLEQVLRRPLRR